MNTFRMKVYHFKHEVGTNTPREKLVISQKICIGKCRREMTGKNEVQMIISTPSDKICRYEL